MKNKIFRCDCGAHLIQFEYEGATKEFDCEDFSAIIYDVYNPETGRKYRKPKAIGDVCLLNNRYGEELDSFFGFMEKIIKNRKKQKRKNINLVSDSDLDKSVDLIKKDTIKVLAENKKLIANAKKKRKK